MRETGWKIEGKTGQRTELSNVRETGWKIEGKTGQMTELSNVRKTGWKIEGMTEETARPEDRSEPAQSPLREPTRGTALRTVENSFRRSGVWTG
ncbi:MAG: hypothetical protein MR441_00635 [Bacteroidales bacterium]|nr:hypothetical protein [Bacteroidales bacterium]